VPFISLSFLFLPAKFYAYWWMCVKVIAIDKVGYFLDKVYKRTSPSRCRFRRAICSGHCGQQSVAVVSPCAAELGRVERQPQHAPPGSTLPPHDVVLPPDVLTKHSSGHTMKCHLLKHSSQFCESIYCNIAC